MNVSWEEALGLNSWVDVEWTVPMHIDGKVSATLYTSHPLDFHVDENKDKGWYFKLLDSGDDEYVWTHVNVETHDVETQAGHLRCHYVTNTNAS